MHVFDDGRMNILVEGSERFRVTAWTDGRAYPTAEVEPLEDEDDATPDPTAAEEALTVFRKLAAVADAEIEEPDGCIGLARLRDRRARRLRHAAEAGAARAAFGAHRLQRLTELLEQALAAMTREREIRERAATNGRVSLG